jgi:hypothetical protein
MTDKSTRAEVIQEVDKRLLDLEAEMDGPRGRLYEKYGSGISDIFSPLWDLCDLTKRDNPWTVRDLLRELFK